jgi:hypothetical protein
LLDDAATGDGLAFLLAIAVIRWREPRDRRRGLGPVEIHARAAIAVLFTGGAHRDE